MLESCLDARLQMLQLLRYALQIVLGQSLALDAFYGDVPTSTFRYSLEDLPCIGNRRRLALHS